MPDDEKYDKIFRLTTYEGKKYLDNFYSCFKDMGIGESCLFILSAFGRIFSNLFGHIIAKDFTPSHVIFLLMIGEIVLAFDSKSSGIIIVNLIVIISVIFLLLI